MASQGFVVNDAEVAGITNTFTSALLHVDETIDPKSVNGELPGAFYASHLEITVDVTAGAVTEIEAFLTWDSAGNSLMFPVSSLTGDNLVAGIGDVSLIGTTVPIGRWERTPTEQTTVGKCYLWIRAAAGGGTMTLKKARLNWATMAMVH